MLVPADAVAQRRYVRSARQSHPKPSMGIGPTILRGLRDLGYRDSASAVAALVDNAIDAHARRIDIAFDVEGGKVEAIAIIDNGIGMVPEMLRAACAVGATCPIGDGPHLGRSGFGLPSAPFAVGRRFALISRPANADLAGVLFDLDDLVSEDVLLPEALRGEFPPFVADHLRAYWRNWTSGTVVVLSELDRLAPRAAMALAAQLQASLGFAFGRYVASGRVEITIEGQTIAGADPLFLEGSAQSANDTADQPAAASEDTGVLQLVLEEGAIQVRTALLPPHLLGASRRRLTHQPRGDQSAFVRDTTGLVVSRLGRRITVLPQTPLFHFTNGDRPIRVELDFPPSLDAEFAPSLSLQQVHVGDRVWAALRGSGVGQHLEMLRRRVAERRMRTRVLEDTAVPVKPATPRRRNRCQKEG